MLYNHIYDCDFAIVQDERRGAVLANKRPWKPQESLSLQVTKVLKSVSDDKSDLILSLLIIIITEKSSETMQLYLSVPRNYFFR